MHNLNTTIFEFVYSLAGHYALVDRVVVFLTDYLVYTISAIAFFYVIFWIPLETPAGFRKLRALAQSAEAILSLFVTWFFVQSTKVLVAYPRPFEVLSHVQPLVLLKGGDSFPSLHAALTMAVATVVYLHHKRLGKALVVFAVLVAISRLYVGVHYPLDIVVGAAIGYAIPTLFHKIFSRNVKKSLAE